MRDKIVDYIGSHMEDYELRHISILESDVRRIEMRIINTSMSLEDACTHFLKEYRERVTEQFYKNIMREVFGWNV